LASRLETFGMLPMPKTPNRPRDPNQLGKLIVDLSVGEAKEQTSPDIDDALFPDVLACVTENRKNEKVVVIVVTYGIKAPSHSRQARGLKCNR
jgi:hypothetical protein